VSTMPGETFALVCVGVITLWAAVAAFLVGVTGTDPSDDKVVLIALWPLTLAASVPVGSVWLVYRGGRWLHARINAPRLPRARVLK
jgi:hypothetical protein